MYTNSDDPFSLLPLLSPEDIRLLGHVIISSNADLQYDRRPNSGALGLVLNDCKDMMNNPGALARMMRWNETDRAHLAFQLFLSLTGNTQFPGQDPRPKEKVGRTLAVFEALPRRYPDRLSTGNKKLVFSLLPKIESYFGTSLTQLSLCFLALTNWQGIAYRFSMRALAYSIGSTFSIKSPRDRQLMIMTALLEEEPSLDSFLVFTEERIARALIYPSAWTGFCEQFAKFLRVFSATTEELRRNAVERPEFQVGAISNRLSPLERYPIVRIEEKGKIDRLSIPNTAHFLKSFSAITDYTLLEALGAEYSQARGALLELYIRCLVEDRLPHLLVIPEISYGHQERRGPDLTIIDRELGKIILVEMKGRRIKLSTRLTMTEEELRENLSDAHEALRKLPRKLADLYEGLAEYRDYQEAIDTTKSSAPIFVAVLSEGVYSLGELAREMGTHFGDPLYNYPFPYCVMALDIFERAIETARRNGEPLAELLHTHWHRSLRREYQNAGADSFDGKFIPESETFAASFAPW